MYEVSMEFDQQGRYLTELLSTTIYDCEVILSWVQVPSSDHERKGTLDDILCTFAADYVNARFNDVAQLPTYVLKSQQSPAALLMMENDRLPDIENLRAFPAHLDEIRLSITYTRLDNDEGNKRELARAITHPIHLYFSY